MLIGPESNDLPILFRSDWIEECRHLTDSPSCFDRPPAANIGNQAAQFAMATCGDAIAANRCPDVANPRLGPYEPGQRRRLPARPVLQSVGQQRMPGHESQ